jgi:hypothetical protein
MNAAPGEELYAFDAWIKTRDNPSTEALVMGSPHHFEPFWRSEGLNVTLNTERT